MSDSAGSSASGRPGNRAGGRATGWVARGLSLVAALLLITMMLVTFVDVIGRYVFNAPLPGAFELTEVLLALVIFVGLPIVTARREHVSVDLLVTRLPPIVQRGLARVAGVVTGAMLAVFAWRLALSARDYAAYGDATVYLGIPLGPVAGLMAVFCALSALVAFWLALKPSRRLRRGL